MSYRLCHHIQPQLIVKVIYLSSVREQKTVDVYEKYYDQGSKQLSDLKPKDLVYMQAGNPALLTSRCHSTASTSHSYYSQNNRKTRLATLETPNI